VARAAWYVGAFATLWAAMQFIFSPIIGAASDRFGRRKVILLSNLGMGLDYVLMAVAPTMGWLFLGRLISGHHLGQLSHRRRLYRRCHAAG
jgi:DHA1 family tetracycline resistance protein-like MFS transporter